MPDNPAKPVLDWECVQTVMLDMDGTLLDLEFDNFFWQQHVPNHYARLKNIAPEQARVELGPRFASRAGTLEWYCLDHWSQELGFDVIALKRELRRRIRFLPSAEEFLRELRRLGKRLILVTNAHPEALALKSSQTGLAEHFDAVVSAHHLGLPKEDIGFWRRLWERQSFVGQNTALIDDSLPVLRAARDYGVEHLVLVRRPDSAAPAREIGEFPSVESLGELLPDR